jgi:hypothetical protein
MKTSGKVCERQACKSTNLRTYLALPNLKSKIVNLKSLYTNAKITKSTQAQKTSTYLLRSNKNSFFYDYVKT